MNYSRVPKNNIIIFDIQNKNDLSYLPYKDKKIEALRIGLSTVPLLFQGKLSDLSNFYDLLDNKSILGDVEIEGIVIKYEGRDVIQSGRETVKVLSKKFRERNTNTKGEKSVCNEARWRKAIQHLIEEGYILNKKLIPKLRDDILINYSKQEINMILKYSVANFPEWFIINYLG